MDRVDSRLRDELREHPAAMTNYGRNVLWPMEQVIPDPGDSNMKFVW